MKILKEYNENLINKLVAYNEWVYSVSWEFTAKGFTSGSSDYSLKIRNQISGNSIIRRYGHDGDNKSDVNRSYIEKALALNNVAEIDDNWEDNFTVCLFSWVLEIQTVNSVNWNSESERKISVKHDRTVFIRNAHSINCQKIKLISSSFSGNNYEIEFKTPVFSLININISIIKENTLKKLYKGYPSPGNRKLNYETNNISSVAYFIVCCSPSGKKDYGRNNEMIDSIFPISILFCGREIILPAAE